MNANMVDVQVQAAIIAFTARGFDLAQDIAKSLSTEDKTTGTAAIQSQIDIGFGESKVSLSNWAKNAWENFDALVFVGATGIAVRAIAPLVANKLSDPAVVVVDESGRWSIPLLSGHVGGANRLAKRIARSIGATAVVTTASDGRGLWAVDEWASRRGLHIVNPKRIKAVASRLLAGAEIAVYSDFSFEGPAPAGVSLVELREQAHVVISALVGDQKDEASSAGSALHSADSALATDKSSLDFEPLYLVPACINLGIGCRRGVNADSIADLVDMVLKGAGISRDAVCCIASIDLKSNEEGLVEFAARRAWNLSFYSAEELSSVEGSVSSSDFVKEVTGLSNVCERAALFESGEGARLLVSKQAKNGVTVAVCAQQLILDWSD